MCLDADRNIKCREPHFSKLLADSLVALECRGNAVTFDDFEAIDVQAEETRIFLRRFGSGPPVLLLHGFPQMHLMWRAVAPLLADRFTVICPDLRGYGRSGCPASRPDHAPYAKRAMAKDMASVMAKLGFPCFSVAGHDRGGRVAYRLALDHPERVDRLAVLDIIPTADAWSHADWKFAQAFWPWSLLGQPEPLPERLLSAAPDGRRISTRCEIPRTSTPSARSIVRQRPSIPRTIWRIGKPGGVSRVRFSCSGAVADR
jgi:pimeloyl-ACP methyl ester carboxylesterase